MEGESVGQPEARALVRRRLVHGGLASHAGEQLREHVAVEAAARATCARWAATAAAGAVKVGESSVSSAQDRKITTDGKLL